MKCDLTDEVYHLIKNTPKVTGFLGADKSKPVPIPDREAERIKGQVAEGVDHPKPSVSFEVGEQVRVSDGPFASFNGVVEEVDHARARLKVAVSIFGRATPVEFVVNVPLRRIKVRLVADPLVAIIAFLRLSGRSLLLRQSVEPSGRGRLGWEHFSSF